MNEETFHLTLRDNPTDELTWQALADFLDDEGQSQRAELLRLTRRMALLPLNERGDLPGRVEALLRAGVKPVVVQREGPIGMRFSLLMPGRFPMGSPERQPERHESERQHEVTLTRPFWMGVFTVTQKQWKAMMGKNPSHFRSGGGGKARVKGMRTTDFPVEQVSWLDAHDFLKKLDQQPEIAQSGWKPSLPTEAQWEYACRGGPLASELPFHFAQPCTSLSSSQANFNGAYPFGGAAEGEYLDRTSRVGSYEPNLLGLYDMHGNVWEWCLDWHADLPARAETDPTGPPSGTARVYRGGCWRAHGVGCHAARRTSSSPGNRANYLGFRVALVPRE